MQTKQRAKLNRTITLTDSGTGRIAPAVGVYAH